MLVNREKYRKLIPFLQFLQERADFISSGLIKLSGAELLEAYYHKWNGYKKAASKTNNICRYLNLNHIETKKYDAMDVQLSSDLGKFCFLSFG